MPWPVYTERILHHGASGNWAYTVPPEHRLIISNVAAVLFVAPPAAINLTVGGLTCFYRAFQATYESFYASMRVVAYQGEVVNLNIGVSGTHVTVVGYLMADPTGRTGPPLGPATKPIEPAPPRVEPHGPEPVGGL